MEDIFQCDRARIFVVKTGESRMAETRQRVGCSAVTGACDDRQHLGFTYRSTNATYEHQVLSTRTYIRIPTSQTCRFLYIARPFFDLSFKRESKITTRLRPITWFNYRLDFQRSVFWISIRFSSCLPNAPPLFTSWLGS